MKDGLTDDEKQMVKLIQGQMDFVPKLPEPDKSRCLLGLAYEYLIMDMEEEAFKLLVMADKEYFGEQLQIDIKTIPNMDIVVMSVLNKLVEIGYVKLEDTLIQ